MSNKTPNISLPQGGGAQSGLGEKFSPDLFTGTGNFSVPIALPAGRNGFQPELAIGYSTGSGNSPFGMGWNLAIPGVMRKTSRGIPVYSDEQDVFILSGAEDLVRVKQTTSNGHQKSYYRPRTEGLYARIVHHKKTSGENYWEVSSKDGLTSFYGNPDETENYTCVVANPLLRNSIFGWNLYKTIDSFGNHIVYVYDREISTNGVHCYDQLYLSHILYGDYVDEATEKYLVRVQFNYEARSDSFSTYKQGFEVRTTKRCKAIEIYTQPKETDLPEGYNSGNSWYEPWECFRIKTKSYTLIYADQNSLIEQPLNGNSQLVSIETKGYNLNDSSPVESMPPLVFRYSVFNPLKRDFFPVRGSDLPSYGLGSNNIELVDLTGDGLPDILQLDGIARWWKNKGKGEFETSRLMHDAPAGLHLEDFDVQMIDANGDGRADLLVNKSELCGYFSTRFGATWDKNTFKKYKYAPSFSFADPEVKLIDIDGDGVTDVLRNGSRLECFYNHPNLGFYKTSVTDKKQLDNFPNISFADPRIRFADMTGDGMQDIVLIHNGSVAYWPNLGYGRFGKKITMMNSPRFSYGYNPVRILLGDVDGDGQADLIYVDNNRVTLWVNKSGNGWSGPVEITGTPPVTDSDSVRLTDLTGSGISGILWSSVYNSSGFSQMFFLDFTGGNKPYLLQEMNNNMGSITRVQYTSSIEYYLKDEQNPLTRWKSELPFPVLVVSRVEVIDKISNGKLATEYSYHHGYWDGVEREFRGFGRVDQRDTETFTTYNDSSLAPLVTPNYNQPFEHVGITNFSPPTETRSWFHQGALGDEFTGWYENNYSHEYWQGDPTILERSKLLSAADVAMYASLPGRAKRDALRTMRGTVLRTELYALDNSPLQNKPYTVTESVGFVRKDYEPAVPVTDTFKYASGYIFFPYAIGQRTTQWERGNDPMTSFSFTWEYDEYGQAQKQLSVSVSRGFDPLTGASFTIDSGKYIPPVLVLATDKFLAVYSLTNYIYKGDMADDEADFGIYIMNRTEQNKGYDCTYSGSALSVIDFYKSVVDNSNIGAVIAHSLNYYDGDAFEGLALGSIGSYGVLVRSESLISTGTIYTAAYGTLPETLQASPSWNAEYPYGFTSQYPERGGYLYYTTGAYTPGYYVRSAANQYDFQTGDGKGLITALHDPFDAETTIAYDDYLLLPIAVTAVTDAEDNTTTAEYDYRVLQPDKVTDINENISVFDFSPLGLLRATAIIGKGTEGDYKSGSGNFYARYEPSTKLEYDFLSFMTSGNPVWVKTIKREYHYQQAVNNDTIVSVEYSDGFGRLIQTRTQAENLIFGNDALERVVGDSGLPATQGENSDTLGVERDAEALLNVVVSGWQIYNNKGKVVEKYEPFFHYGFDYVASLNVIFGPDGACLDTNTVYKTINIAGSTYAWTAVGAEIVSGQDTSEITLKWDTPGNKVISVKEIKANNEEFITSFELTVHPLPDPNLTSTASTICAGLPVTFSVNNYNPNFIYDWEIGGSPDIIEEAEDYIIVSWGSPGEKEVGVTVSSSTCDYTPVYLDDSVEVILAPSGYLSSSASTVCTTIPVTISANDDLSYTYTWDLGEDAVIVNQTDDHVTVYWTSLGYKAVTVLVNNGGCEVEFGPLNIAVSGYPPTPVITGDAAPPVMTPTFYTVVTPIPGNTYTWTVSSGGTIISGQGSDTVEVEWNAPYASEQVDVYEDNAACGEDAAPFSVVPV